MSAVPDHHDRLNAEIGADGFPVNYGRPERAARAVRNGVGLTEMDYGVVVVEGDDRVEFVDNAVSNRVPETDGDGCYALLLTPSGGIRADLYVYSAASRILILTPRERASTIADEWAERTFVQDVSVDEATGEFGIFGVHGPFATEKIASVLNGAAAPSGSLRFVRGSIADVGVTVLRTDAPLGEEGYEVVCTAADAATVFDALLNYGLNAAPFGAETFTALSLEAGTPLFEFELEDEIPNVVGLRNALDFEKGCYVGQEVVSRIENRGRPNRRLVGLRTDEVSTRGETVYGPDGDAVGRITRGERGPTTDAAIAMALADADADITGINGADAAVEPLPFVDGSERSARIPSYPSEAAE